MKLETSIWQFGNKKPNRIESNSTFFSQRRDRCVVKDFVFFFSTFIGNQTEREDYGVELAEEVEAGDDEVGESEAVDLLSLVLVRQELVHHLQEHHMPIFVEQSRRRMRRRKRRRVRWVSLRIHGRQLLRLRTSHTHTHK